MNGSFTKVQNSKLPERYKIKLIKDLQYIFSNIPVIEEIILFGSLARGELTYQSDIDICVVLPVGDSLQAPHLRMVRAELRDSYDGVTTDVIFCHKHHISPNAYHIVYREIHRDGIQLYKA